MQYTVKTLAIILASATLAACSGGGGSSSSTGSSSTALTGQFVDSPTKGLRYVSGDLTGTTDENGTFKYTAGSKVKFYVGDILLGEANGDSIITPVQLVTGAQDVTNETVTNIVRFLTTLDDDNNPANGIVISDAVAKAAAGKTIQFNQTASSFAATGADLVLINDLTKATTAGIRTVTTVSDAQTHAQDSMKNILAGDYSGTFGGASSGSWSGTLGTDGVIKGSGQTSQGASFTFSGKVAMDGSGKSDFTTSGGVSNGTIFSGAFSTNGNASGQWNWSNQQTGTWTGKLTKRANATMTTSSQVTANSSSVPVSVSTTPASTPSSAQKYNATMMVTQNGNVVQNQTAVVDAKPATQADFCAPYNQAATEAQKQGLSYSHTCSYDGTTGTESATVNVSGYNMNNVTTVVYKAI